jgi:hypothetical protein
VGEYSDCLEKNWKVLDNGSQIKRFRITCVYVCISGTSKETKEYNQIQLINKVHLCTPFVRHGKLMVTMNRYAVKDSFFVFNRLILFSI